MPMYSVKHLKTGEQKEMTMTISQYEESSKDNSNFSPEWSDLFSKNEFTIKYF